MLVLSKRVMSPANIVNNIVRGDKTLALKAQQYFQAACRSVVGYKQIAAYLNTIATVEIKKVAITNKEELVITADPMDKYRREALAFKMMLEGKGPSIKPKPTTPVIEKPKQEFNSGYFDPFAEFEEESEIASPTYNEEVFNPIPSNPYQEFAQELRYALSKERKLDSGIVSGIVKDLWAQWKDQLDGEWKVSAKNLCIQVHEQGKVCMERLPKNWFFFTPSTFIPSYVNPAIDYCAHC